MLFQRQYYNYIIIIYVVYCMGKWREGERQKVDSNMKE